MKPYKLKSQQALHAGDNNIFTLGSSILQNMENFLGIIVLGESMFHLSAKDNRYNARIWESENPCIVEHESGVRSGQATKLVGSQTSRKFK